MPALLALSSRTMRAIGRLPSASANTAPPIAYHGAGVFRLGILLLRTLLAGQAADRIGHRTQALLRDRLAARHADAVVVVGDPIEGQAEAIDPRDHERALRERELASLDLLSGVHLVRVRHAAGSGRLDRRAADLRELFLHHGSLALEEIHGHLPASVGMVSGSITSREQRTPPTPGSARWCVPSPRNELARMTVSCWQTGH